MQLTPIGSHCHVEWWYKKITSKFLLNQFCVVYLFAKRERSLISSALKKSSFLKSILLSNFAFDVIYTGNLKNSNQNNSLKMFKQVLFNDFELMLLQKLFIGSKLGKIATIQVSKSLWDKKLILLYFTRFFNIPNFTCRHIYVTVNPVTQLGEHSQMTSHKEGLVFL